MGSRSPHGGRRVPDIMNGNKRDRGRRPPSRSCSPHDTKRSSPGATVAKDTEKDGCKSCSRSHTKSSCSDSSDSDAESQNSQAVDAEAVVNAGTVETTSLAAAGAAAATAVMGKSLEVKANEELEDTGKQSNKGFCYGCYNKQSHCHDCPMCQGCKSKHGCTIDPRAWGLRIDEGGLASACSTYARQPYLTT